MIAAIEALEGEELRRFKTDIEANGAATVDVNFFLFHDT